MSKLSEREEYENVFSYFVDALEVLSHPAAQQCQDLGNYNAPWEIKDHITDFGLNALSLGGSYLSDSNRQKINILLSAVEGLDDEDLVTPAASMCSHYGCITALQRPSWEPLRSHARKLLNDLAPEIRRNKMYFREL